MKHYLVEPTWKKSVVEYEIFKRKDEDGNTIFLRKELGWRWGSFMVSVPETEEEALEWVKNQGYETLKDWAGDYGHLEYDDETGEYIEDPETSYLEMIVGQSLPNETDEFVDITEDYDMEMIECWDGCWEDWDVYCYQTEIDELQKEEWLEEAIAAWEEDYQEGVEELGWEYVDNMFEMQCSPKITPCTENGKPLEEATEE